MIRITIRAGFLSETHFFTGLVVFQRASDNVRLRARNFSWTAEHHCRRMNRRVKTNRLQVDVMTQIHDITTITLTIGHTEQYDFEREQTLIPAARPKSWW